VSERVRLRLEDDLRRPRLAVLVRLPLGLPPALVLVLWLALAAVALAVAWPATLVLGRMPRALHRFLLGFVRFAAQVVAWLSLVSRAFRHAQVDAVRVAQRRPATLFRWLLAAPGIVLASVLAVILAGVAVASWVAALALGRTTAGLRELGAFCLRYILETLAYLLLLTARYPALEAPQAPQ
jgi:Domain of unknown function (DUF4389)